MTCRQRWRRPTRTASPPSPSGSPGRAGLRPWGLGLLLERLYHDAPWAVTEVRPSAEFKFRRQRYISQDVYDHWRTLPQRHPKVLLGHLAKDAEGKTLCHEHVVPRKDLRRALQGLDRAEALQEVLAGAAACVVTQDEHRRLELVRDVAEWDRYRQAKAPVGVYDRLKRCWVVGRHDAPAEPA